MLNRWGGLQKFLEVGWLLGALFMLTNMLRGG